jgi:hypothetical protein
MRNPHLELKTALQIGILSRGILYILVKAEVCKFLTAKTENSSYV